MSDPVFFAPAQRLSAAEIAAMTGAGLLDPSLGGVAVATIASARDGGQDALVFVEGRRNARLLDGLRAAAVLCTAELAGAVPAGIAVLVCKSPQRAFGQVGRFLFPDAAKPPALTGVGGISPTAFVDPAAALEDGVVVEPGAVISAGTAIGTGTIIAPNAVVGRGCRIGRDCYIGPGAVVQYALVGNGVVIHAGAKIGQDGFGFVPGPAGPERMPQIGRVVIQDGVEIGANTSIDRGAMADTVIGENTKIDNLVQIAHNVRIGRNCVVAGLTGISGSVTIGDGVMIAGGVGIADHLTIGDGAQLAARSGFMHDVPAGEVWGGYPAKPMAQAFREMTVLSRLAARRSGKDKSE